VTIGIPLDCVTRDVKSVLQIFLLMLRSSSIFNGKIMSGRFIEGKINFTFCLDALFAY
jgi:hypothetical protein